MAIHELFSTEKTLVPQPLACVPLIHLSQLGNGENVAERARPCVAHSPSLHTLRHLYTGSQLAHRR
jgi:hypothetical protein